jgi:succinate dehydrogenase / fumarate reductase flavoprotein subunit
MDTMQDLVGIIRTRSELEEAIARIRRLRERAQRVGVKGSRIYNPGWHLALDLFTMLTVAEAVAMSALAREESRGGHTRDDFPKPDAAWGRKNVVVRRRDGQTRLTTEPLPEVPAELRPLIGEDKPTGKVALEPVAASSAKE